jgi:hypothetical protein
MRKPTKRPTTQRERSQMKISVQNQMAVFLGAVLAITSLPARAQNLVQNLSISLTAYEHTGAKPVRITTKEIISYFAQTNVPGARLLLVTPLGNAPGTLGNLNAFLRVAKGDTVIVDVPSPDTFNLYQDFAAIHTTGTRTSSRAINRFSFDFLSFHAELQGFSTWNITEKTVDGVDISGTGSFSANVNGAVTVDGVTEDVVPVHGTITAGPPKVVP